jgi:hypothetical protein
MKAESAGLHDRAFVKQDLRGGHAIERVLWMVNPIGVYHPQPSSVQRHKMDRAAYVL